MGTTFNITLVAPAEDFADKALQSRISESLEHVDNLASTWKRRTRSCRRCNAERIDRVGCEYAE